MTWRLSSDVMAKASVLTGAKSNELAVRGVVPLDACAARA